MYIFESRIRYSETDSGGKLTMASLINYFQDCSTFHSEDVGLGLEYLKERGLVWVLSAWQIVVERYPELCEKVTIGTQPYDMKGFLGYRNFAMLDGEGRYLAKANSLWSLLDVNTGKPVGISEEMLQGYSLGEKLDMDYAPRKITLPREGLPREGMTQEGVSCKEELQEAITVKKHHLDTNHHVNNQQFISIAMEYLPENFTVGQVRAEYKKQAFLEDVLLPRVIAAGEKVYVALEDQDGKLYAAVEFTEMPVV